MQSIIPLFFNRLSSSKLLSVTILLISSMLPSTFVSANTRTFAHAKNMQFYMSQIVNPSTPRNYRNITELNRVAAWIKEQMRLFDIHCEYQHFVVNSLGYKNIICHVPAQGSSKQKLERIILAAHYDVKGQNQGLNNNASGVVGLIEAARLLKSDQKKLNTPVDIVFHSLEEAPFFKTEYMGSLEHAKALKKQKLKVKGVFLLDSIGNFKPDMQQSYPYALMWLYPNQPDFVASVANMKAFSLSQHYCEQIQLKLGCERFFGALFFQKYEYSAYENYNKYHYPTVLITDTAYYRNSNYDRERERMDDLDFNKMENIVNALVKTVVHIGQ
ncbi:hypothetical protein A3K93_03730 [Acinetobacter sp. NCu2D-2]|uniref:M28 family peptidase n=1 Tax=Acinetobacter sp. NCu2D-2 TaxID=1608473 RepID=UPI0007CDB0EF|nr:M28 family peptidase [Acinetobacter sp. NCu2D-2]ANF81390.1 hypothetical protein A3K93_03730 [Acinetobacter sp. NCu2D-2]